MRESFMFKVIPVFIWLVWILIIASWIFAGTVLVKSAEEINKHGLKSVIERVWEGASK